MQSHHNKIKRIEPKTPALYKADKRPTNNRPTGLDSDPIIGADKVGNLNSIIKDDREREISIVQISNCLPFRVRQYMSSNKSIILDKSIENCRPQGPTGLKIKEKSFEFLEEADKLVADKDLLNDSWTAIIV